MNPLAAITVLVSVLFALCFAWSASSMKDKLNRAERNQRWYDHWFKSYNGWNAKHGTLRLASFDCGRTWYHVETTDDEPVKGPNGFEGRHGFKIIKPADPEMIKEVMAFSKLADTVRERGAPLNPADPNDAKLLEDAGFQLITK